MFNGSETDPRLCFDSAGGSYQEGVAIARVLLEGYPMVGTGIGDGASCASACALAFMAGRHDRFEDRPIIPDRVLHPGGRLGFHAIDLVAPDQFYAAKDVNDAYALALSSISALLELRRAHPDFAFPESLLIESLRTGPLEMRWIETVRDAARWDIAVAPVSLPGMTAPTLPLDTRSPPDWGTSSTELRPWQHAIAQICLTELVRGDYETEVTVPDVRYLGRSRRGEPFEVDYTYGESGGTCAFHFSPTLTSPSFHLPDWSVGQISVDPSWRGEVAQTDRELAAHMASPLDTPLGSLPTEPKAASASQDGIAALTHSRGAPAPLTNCLPDSPTRVVNVNEFTNLGAGAGLDSQIITRVPLAESASVLEPTVYFPTDVIATRCLLACKGPSGEFRDPAVALQCIESTQVWPLVTTLSGYEGFLSRKFLE